VAGVLVRTEHCRPTVWLSVGSINFDNRSLKLNDEVALVVQDGGLGRELHEMFLDDLEYAKEIRLDDFQQRSLPERLRERGAWVFSSLL
jgi:cardiolipin synthase